MFYNPLCRSSAMWLCMKFLNSESTVSNQIWDKDLGASSLFEMGVAVGDLQKHDELVEKWDRKR